MILSTLYHVFSIALFFAVRKSDFVLFAEAKRGGLKGRFHQHKNIRPLLSNDITPHSHTQKAHVILKGLPAIIHLTPQQKLTINQASAAAFESFNTDQDVYLDDITEQGDNQGSNRRDLGWNPSHGKFYDYSIYIKWHCSLCLNSLWRRRQLLLLPDKNHANLERTLYSMLHSDVDPLFQNLTDCRIIWDDEVF